MCTLTWIHADGGYELLFNRDELKSRGPERPPALHDEGGLRAVAPGDSDSGGTWIAANELGVSLCLLNGYVARRGPAPRRATSRGLLVRSLFDARSASDVTRRLAARDLAPFEPFVLAVFDPGDVGVFRWDGVDGHFERPTGLPLLASSGVDQPRAQEERRRGLERVRDERGVLTAAALAAFHGSHADGPDAWSPCMHRADAETRSLCRIAVTPSEVRFAYAPGAPCGTPLGAPLRLARSAAPRP